MLTKDTNLNGYTNFERIGTGAYGNVYKALNTKNSNYVAVKEIDTRRCPKNKIENEIKIMKKIKSENSVSVIEEIEVKDYYYIIMDLCISNLEEHIKMRKNPISIEEIRYILIQLNNVFRIMNSENLTHRDLKPQNILISNQRLDKTIIKLSDYGCSKEVGDTNTFTGTILTIAPEIIEGKEKDISKSDLWSLGVIIYYMYFKKYPYIGNNEYQIMNVINSGIQLEKIENDELNDLVNKLLTINSKERISWDEYFNHPFFKNSNESKEQLIKKINLLEKELKAMKHNNTDNINKGSKNPLYVLSNHLDWIKCLIVLKDGRLVSCSEDNSIIIYNKQTYQTDIIINEHESCVNCLIQLKNGNLVSCSDDKTIKLFNIKEKDYEVIQTLTFHSNFVNKILELSNDTLISGSSDSTIIFYIKDNLTYKKDYSISASSLVKNIIQTKQNEIVYSTNDGKLNFYDINERKNKKIIENVISSYSSFLMITKDLLLVSGENKMNIINVNDYNTKEIYVPNVGEIRGLCMLNANNIITGDEDGTLTQWKIEGDNLIKTKSVNAHDDNITVIINLDGNHIASGSYDDKIKIWEFDLK